MNTGLTLLAIALLPIFAVLNTLTACGVWVWEKRGR